MGLGSTVKWSGNRDEVHRLLKRPTQDVTLAYCWAHARRKLHEVTQSGTAPIAQEGLAQIQALYRIEKDLRGLPADHRRAARQDRSKPIIDAFELWLAQNRARVSAKSPTGEALKYIAKYWDGLILFLDNGRIELDNNRKRCAAPTLTEYRLICDSEAPLICGEFLDGSYERVSGKCSASGGRQAELAA